MPRARGGRNKWNAGRYLPKRSYGRRLPYARKASGSKRWKPRPRARPTVLSPTVHRKLYSTGLQNWAIVPADATRPINPLAHLTPFYCQVPNQTWTQYTRGFDVSQVTSSAIRSKNITAHLTIQCPSSGPATQAYQFRIVHGFTKFPTAADIHSSTGTGGAYDGIVPNFVPSEKFQDNASQTLSDAIGISNGNYNVRGNIRMGTVRVLSDKTITVQAESTTNMGAKLFNPISLNYHWATNKRMKLYPYVEGADAGAYQGEALTPVNNPNLEIPFIALIALNFGQYSVDADRPVFQLDWTHYWNCC